MRMENLTLAGHAHVNILVGRRKRFDLLFGHILNHFNSAGLELAAQIVVKTIRGHLFME